MVELLPCPFCGGSAFISPHQSNAWAVRCHGDDGSGCGLVLKRYTHYALVTAWNTRAPAVRSCGDYEPNRGGDAT